MKKMHVLYQLCGLFLIVFWSGAVVKFVQIPEHNPTWLWIFMVISTVFWFIFLLPPVITGKEPSWVSKITHLPSSK